MRSTLEDIGCKRSNSDRYILSNRDSFKSYSNDELDELIEDDLHHRIRSLETNLFAEYCSELPDDRIERLCSRR